MLDLKGISLFVWYWKEEAVSAAQAMGAARVLVKAADGTTPWIQWPGAAARCKEIGLECVPWAYSYGDPAEIAVLTKQADASGIKQIIIDPEVEFERKCNGNPEFVTAWVNALAAARRDGYEIACCTWAQPAVHPAYPFRQMADVINLWIPMIAWQVWDPQDFEYWAREWNGRLLGASVPWLLTEKTTPEALVSTVQKALAMYEGAALWRFNDITYEQMTALRASRCRDVLDAATPEFDAFAAAHARAKLAVKNARAALDQADAELDEVWVRFARGKQALGMG